MDQKQNGRVLTDAPAHHFFAADVVNLDPSQEAKAQQRNLILDALSRGPLTTLAKRADGIAAPRHLRAGRFDRLPNSVQRPALCERAG